jgi:hypothetical protein
MHKLFRPLIGLIILVAAGLIAATVAFPFAAGQAPPSNQNQATSVTQNLQSSSSAPASSATATITWSVPQFSATLFPGTSTTTTITFRSSEPLGSTTLEVTPSLSGIVTLAPTSFSAVNANQDYTVTLTLTAPPDFQKRSFGGTIHIRNAGMPPRTYDTPLAVNLVTDFNTYSSSNFSISYPVGWSVISPDTTADEISFFPVSKQLDPSNEYIGDIVIEVFSRSTATDLQTFYSSVAPIDLFQNSQTASSVSINGMSGAVFMNVNSMIPTNTVAIMKNDIVLEISDIGIQHASDRVLDAMVSSVR